MRATNDCTREKKVVPGILVHRLKLRGTQAVGTIFTQGQFLLILSLQVALTLLFLWILFSALNLYTELSMRINVRVD